MNKTFILLILSFLACHVKGNQGCIFEHLSTEHGLSHGSVSVMLKDKEGFMWFGTWNGINRYDGHSFKQYNLTDDTGMLNASNRIEKLKQDSLGNVWIITNENKAMRYNYMTEQFKLIPEILNDVNNIKVHDLYCTTLGDVWLLTNNNGVYRVVSDKVSNIPNVVNYCTETKTKLPDNAILFVFEDKQGGIWINTNKGITHLALNPESNVFENHAHTGQLKGLLNSNIITSMYSNGEYLYFGTQKGYIIAFNATNNKANLFNIGSNSSINQIVGTLNGNLYLGTNENGVYEFNEWSQEITKHYNFKQINSVLKLYVDSRNYIWIESTEIGISKINSINQSFRHYEQKLDVTPDIRPEAQCGLFEDSDKTLWLTLKGGGFGYFNSQTDEIEYFYNKPGDENRKMSNFVRCFYKDASGVLWISTYFKGIEKVSFVENKFKITQPAPKSKFSISNEIRAIYQDSRTNIWVATKNQEVYILDKNFKITELIKTLNGKPIGNVYSIIEDSKGHIFLGTKGNGLFKLTPKKGFDFKVQQFQYQAEDSFSLSNDNIYSLYLDTRNRLWVGTFGGGVNVFINNKFYNTFNELHNFPFQNGFRVRHITEDQNGNIWIATTKGIILSKAKNILPSDFEFKLYNIESNNTVGMKSNDIFWIHCDDNNRIWLAQLGGGLAEIVKTPNNDEVLEMKSFSTSEGLSSNVVFSIVNDSRGSLWLATENGIVTYNPKEKIFKNLSLFNGIANPVISEASVFKHASGDISFGTYNGMYTFNPNGFTGAQQKINLVLTSFKLFGKEVNSGELGILAAPINQTKKITLKHNQNVFTFTWAGLSHNTQEKLQYACKLIGFDRDWIAVRDQNQINYTKIPPGNYTFTVKFLNNDLQIENEPKYLTIEILPPFWKTWKAYLIYFTIGLILAEFARRTILTFIRLRNNVVIEKQLTELKLNFFTNISHELRTPLTLIQGPVGELKTKEKLSAQGFELLELIDKNTKRLLHLVNQLLDFRKIQSKKMQLKLQNLNIVSFVYSVSSNFNTIAKENNINYSIRSSSNEIGVQIDEDKMYSVVYNLLSNAFKFTPIKGNISIIISESEQGDHVFIEIKDSGIGVSQMHKDSIFNIFTSYKSLNSKFSGSGIGLALSKEIVELHSGAIDYKPNSPKGAVFTVKLNTSDKPIVKADIDGKPFEQNAIKPENWTQLKPLTKQQSILIVEDNADLRKFLTIQLADKYSIHEAVNGKEGLGKAIEIHPDIIISDIMMPEMDGIEMLEKLKNNIETSHIPIILLTAKTSADSKIEGLKFGADAYLTKPFDNEQLKMQIDNLIRQRLLLRNYYSSDILNNNFLDKYDWEGITQKDEEFLNKTRLLIEDNLLNAEFKVEVLYKETAMGRSTFSNKIKGLTGLSPIDFVKEYRINKALQLLQNGNYNISEVSYNTGYSDAGYFSKCFKERFGMNPSDVLKK